MSRGDFRSMVAFELSKPIIYREEMVRSYYEKLLLLASRCMSRKQFESESLEMVNAIFNKIDLEAREYYAICKIRAELLNTLRWAND